MASTVVLITGKDDKTARVPSATNPDTTGANSGVGFATAKIIASTFENFHVLVAGRFLQKAEAAVSEIKAAGVKGLLSAIQLDVTDDKSIENAATFVDQKFGKLDVLVNNAGVANGDPDIKVRLRKCMDTNVTGPALVSAAFRPLLLKSQKPYSIYVSSVTGSLALASDPNSPPLIYRGPPRGEAYRASKAALNMLILQELVGLGDAPLKIFAVCPGFVRSNIAGTGEVGRIRNSKAGDPEDSARLILSVIQGKRDEDVGRFIHQDGVYPW
jgi:NAD(P)-dependent dehydrogenase (short-subunit alcohol dehydrogenase family)